MLIPAIVAVITLMLPVSYVIIRKLSVTRQEIVFTTPQDGVKAVYVDLQEDKVRRLYVVYADGSISEVVTSPVVSKCRGLGSASPALGYFCRHSSRTSRSASSE